MMDQENELLELSGTVESVIYKNEENGYTVLRLKDGNDEMSTVVGYCFPYAAAGESMVITGEWTVHGTHGKQFKASFAERFLPSTADAIYRFLSDGSVKGLGPATAALIVDKFGDKTLNVLMNDPAEIATVKGIGSSRAKQICTSFRKQAGVRILMEFVCSYGIRPVIALRMHKYYGEKALESIRENPYIICASMIGGSFSEADKMAMQLGLGENSTKRIASAVLFELIHNTGNGHCFIPKGKLADATAQLIDVDTDDVLSCIETLVESGDIVFEKIAGCEACYLPELYSAETDCAERFAQMCRRTFSDKADLTRVLKKLETQYGIEYAPMQKKTLELALRNQLLVITGGPGTGKTTSIRAILSLFDSLSMKTLLCAPTGRAAKRMTELTGHDAATVHRMLGAKFDEETEKVIFTKDESDRLNCDAVILDESSMMDIQLTAALLRAMPPDARLIMVGDADQLPSVGPGNVFSALIRSEVVGLVRLTEIFRQRQDSRIIKNAHMINRGEHPNLSENTGDFFRLKRHDALSSVETISELCTRRLPEKMNIPSEDIQVLSPTRKGDMGTISLNKVLQQALNPRSPDKKEKLFGDVVFREGDRVMQIRNNYDVIWQSENGETGMGMFNGDMGNILSINSNEETLTVNFDGRIAEYSFDALIELEHAWAVTVHKAQGSEYRAVILALGQGSRLLFTRDVLYTAVTRAKSLLIIVGNEQLAYQMIDNFRQSRRYTALRIRLRKLCGVQ